MTRLKVAVVKDHLRVQYNSNALGRKGSLCLFHINFTSWSCYAVHADQNCLAQVIFLPQPGD